MSLVGCSRDAESSGLQPDAAGRGADREFLRRCRGGRVGGHPVGRRRRRDRVEHHGVGEQARQGRHRWNERRQGRTDRRRDSGRGHVHGHWRYQGQGMGSRLPGSKLSGSKGDPAPLFATKGRKGGVTYAVTIDTNVGGRSYRDGRSSPARRRTRGYRAKASRPRTPTTPSAPCEGRCGANRLGRRQRLAPEHRLQVPLGHRAPHPLRRP